MYIRTTLIALVICLSGFGLQAQDDTDYASTLQKMFEVSGMENNYKIAIEQSFDMMRQQFEEWSIPTDMSLEEMKQDFLETSIDDLVEMLIPVYQKHLTLDDLNAIIAFHKTPVGKKLAEKTPMITQESMQIGYEWGRQIGEKYMQRMQEMGK